MSRLEERYRAVLRLLPADYRARWEREMVAAFLESMDSGDLEQDEYVRDYGRPSWSEVGSVAALAVRLRLGLNGAGTRRSVTSGAAVRLAVLMALLASAVTGVVGAGFRLWLAGALAWLPDPPSTWVAQIPSRFWYVASDLSGLFWLAAYLAFLLGQRAAGRAFIVLGMVPGAAVAALSTVDVAGVGPSVTLWVALLTDGALLLGTVAFQPGVAHVRIRPWLWALPVGVVTVAGFWLGAIVPTGLLDWAGLHAVLVVAAALAYLGGAGLRLVRPAPAWSLALLVLAAAALVARLITLLDYVMLDPASGRGAWLLIGAAEAAALLAVGAPLAVLTNRTLPRRVPA